jgi:nitroreductase
MKQTIRQRRTLKVLADEKEPWPPAGQESEQRLRELLELAACAPYHYCCEKKHHHKPLDSPAPWRFYALSSANCRRFLQVMLGDKEKLGKIGRMLAAADGLVIVTWLPDSPDHKRYRGFQAFEPTKRNMEHIAATSAAIQNMLLAATADGHPSYWSSGGVLRSEAVFERLSIPLDQVLLGAVFVFPIDTDNADTKPGGNRDKTGEAASWMRWQEIE